MRNRDEFLTLREEPQERDITTRSFAVRADSVDEKNRSVEAIIATEDAVAVFDMRSWDIIDEVLRMDGAQLPSQVPLLANHDRYSLDSVYGSTRSFTTGEREIVGRLFFAEGDPDAERAWNKVKQKHIDAVSAGYRAVEYTDIDPGQSAVVKGRSYTAGQRRLRVTTRWELREVSLVPIGADKRSRIRSESNHQNKETAPMNPKLKAFLVSLGLRAEATDQEANDFYSKLGTADKARADAAAAATDTQRSEPPAQPAAPPATAPVAPAADAARTAALEEGARAERDRVRQITDLAGVDVPADVRTRAINEGWDVNRASREFLTAVRGSRGPDGEAQRVPAQHSRSHDADVTVRSLSAGLAISLGLDPLRVRSHDGRRHGTVFTAQEAELGERLSRLSAVDLCRECVLIDSGRNIRDYEDAVRAAVSGASFTNIFSTSVYARLIAGWEKVADTTGGWCDEEDVANFMTQEDISVTASARPEKLPRGDTAKHATATDSKETYRIARFAKQFVVDEQDMIDDRLSAIMRMPLEMGEQCRELRPNLVYNTILTNPTLSADSGAVFNATAVTTAGGHANLGTGALTSDNLKLAITAMGKQRENGRVLNLKPQVLLVPAALEWKADELTTAAMLAKLFADSADPNYSPENLIARKRLRVVMDDRIGLGGVIDPNTGSVRAGTDTNWFLTAGGSKGIRVAYRRGTGRAPQVRSFALDRGQWGMGWDINMDIGVAFMDYRPWYKSTGAA